MAKVIERIEARYEVQEVEFGTVYSWRPQSVLIECRCEERVSLTASEVICEECGAGHTNLLKQYLTESRLRGDEETHPWRYSLKSASGTSAVLKSGSCRAEKMARRQPCDSR